MNTYNQKVLSTSNILSVRAFLWPASMFDEKDIVLTDDWYSVWMDFAGWILVDPTFGTAKFAESSHRRIFEEIALLAHGLRLPRRQWCSVAAGARLALRAELSANLDDECTAAIAAAYAFAMAALTGKSAWAVRTLAASAHSRACGWSAYARSFSTDRIYREIRALTLAAQQAELSRLFAMPGANQTKRAA